MEEELGGQDGVFWKKPCLSKGLGMFDIGGLESVIGIEIGYKRHVIYVDVLPLNY